MFSLHRVAHRASRLLCRAQANRPRPTPGSDPRLQRGSPPSQETTPQQDEDMKVVKLQDADVEGVARVDTNGDWESDPQKVKLMVAGDFSMLLLFAALGRANHGELLDLDLLVTAFPFWAGWFATAPFLGAYGKEAQDGYVKPAALVAGKCCLVATPLALVIRGLVRGYAPPAPFIAVSFVATGALMIGWRSLLAAATKPEDQLTPLERFRKSKSRKGSAGLSA